MSVPRAMQWQSTTFALAMLLSGGCASPSRDSCDSEPSFSSSSSGTRISATSQRIIGGKPATHDWPALARLTVGGHHHCAAVLVASTWVLTAGHCVVRAGDQAITVVLGEHSVDAQDYAVTQSIIHPHLNTLQGSAPDHDLALLRLADPVRLGPHVAIAQTDSCAEADELWIAGWGRTEVATTDGASRVDLHEVRVPLAAYDD